MNELHTFIKEKKIATIGFMVPSLAQAPIFLSMFLGLKKMTALPVESMQTGGMLWFQDLTVADPYYLLPVIITGTLYLIIEVIFLYLTINFKIQFFLCMFLYNQLYGINIWKNLLKIIIFKISDRCRRKFSNIN